MKEIINGSKIEFLNEETDEIVMYIDCFADEYIWYFKDSNEIILTQDMELFELIKKLMLQQYMIYDSEVLKSYKDKDKLVWYSDCYYNPDDKWSRNNVSYLTIIYDKSEIKLKCIKPLDKIIDRKDKSHVIAFSPCGNGRCTRNLKTGMTLQDDFVIDVYQKLLKKWKVKKLHRK